jgi:mono/diheme cytochrome c family protein
MKDYIAAISALAALLIASVAVAQQEKSSGYKYHGDAKVYDALANAPEKARAKRNPLEDDPDAIAAGRILFEQHCSECHETLGMAQRRLPVSAPRKFRTPRPVLFFGF